MLLFINCSHCNLNVTGTVYFTLTREPFCLHGIHRGIDLITRTVSLSRDGSTDLTTRTLPIEPLTSIMNVTITRPSNHYGDKSQCHCL